METIYSGKHAFQSTTIIDRFLSSSLPFLSLKPHHKLSSQQVHKLRTVKIPGPEGPDSGYAMGVRPALQAYMTTGMIECRNIGVVKNKEHLQ